MAMCFVDNLVFDQLAHVSCLVPGFNGLTFVIFPFALGGSDFKFNVATLSEQFERYDGFALLLGLDHFVYFPSFGEQAPSSGLIRFANSDTSSAVDSRVEQI